jgi:hypothetical protein
MGNIFWKILETMFYDFGGDFVAFYGFKIKDL